MSEKIAALICIWFVVFINCYSVKLTQKFLKFFGYGKIVSLAVIIGGGIYFNVTGKAEQSAFKYENAFQFDNNGSFIFPQGPTQDSTSRRERRPSRPAEVWIY